MLLKFTEEEINNKENVVEIEDIIVYGESIEVFDDYYVILGKGEVDGELYSNFQVEFTLVQNPVENTAKAILNTDWEEYDFVF